MNDRSTRLQITPQGSRLVLDGEIDAHTAPDLGRHLDPLPGDGGDVVLDVGAIEFIDSSGLRLIVEAHQRAEADNRRLVVSQPSPAVVRLLEISGLTEHLTIETADQSDG